MLSLPAEPQGHPWEVQRALATHSCILVARVPPMRSWILISVPEPPRGPAWVPGPPGGLRTAPVGPGP